MPGCLKTLSYLNPFTYILDAMRTFVLAGNTSTFAPTYHYAVILLTSLLWSSFSARLYPRLAS
jgi:ABC-2 type transport system permease protein